MSNWVPASEMIQQLVHQHDIVPILLAGVMCILGATVMVRLLDTALAASERARLDWCFLVAVTGGASVWATHFMAMLGHGVGARVTFDPELTIASIIIAVVGFGIASALATALRGLAAIALGGLAMGLTVTAMHYVGMAAYRVAAPVHWDYGLVAASVIVGVILSGTAISALHFGEGRGRFAIAAAGIALSILCIHFIGMAAFSVEIAVAEGPGADRTTFNAMAMAVTLCALLVLGVGRSSMRISDRDRLRSEVRLKDQALCDALTGLPNRRHFREQLTDQCKSLKSEGSFFSLLMVDLDRFKAVNDTLGHPAGDELLKRVAGRLQYLIKDTGINARLGGDEFAVILFPQADPSFDLTTADNIVELLSRPFIIGGQIAEIGASIGVVRAPANGNQAETLLQNADVALYAAKDAGRSTYRVFEEGMMTRAQARRSVENDLRRAVQRDEFVLNFQPLMDPATGRFTGAEALVRWMHPTKGSMSPAEFVPLAEEIGVIRQLGEWVLWVACSTATEWPDPMKVAVNVSPLQLEDENFSCMVLDTLEETGLAPSRLELEITETTLLQESLATKQTLTALHAAGISIALDDFGTGYSSLTYLSQYPISRIKIDKSFFGSFGQVENQEVVRAIAELGRHLNIAVTAEGIETDMQSEFAAECGCAPLQGYLYGRPVPSQELPGDFRPAAPTLPVAAE